MGERRVDVPLSFVRRWAANRRVRCADVPSLRVRAVDPNRPSACLTSVKRMGAALEPGSGSGDLIPLVAECLAAAGRPVAKQPSSSHPRCRCAHDRGPHLSFSRRADRTDIRALPPRAVVSPPTLPQGWGGFHHFARRWLFRASHLSRPGPRPTTRSLGSAAPPWSVACKL